MLAGNLASLLKPIGNAFGVDSAINQLFGLLKQSSSQNDNSSRPISDFHVLAFGKFDHKLRNLIFDFHLLQNGGTIVRDSNIAIARDQDLVHA